jgi:1-phosphofructokinase family hexose kinase
VIFTAGLSPAWQQIMRFASVRSGEVNRAEEVHWCASGKVINVAWALSSLGADVEMLSTIGGATGEAIRQQVEGQGIAGHWVPTSTATRVCTTLLDAVSGAVTELVENTAAVTDDELQQFARAYEQCAKRAELVVLTGSLPAGAPATFYRDLLRATPCPAILDFRGPELWAALECHPLLVKPNREELGRTVGRELQTDAELQAGITELQQRGAQWVVITDGGRPLLASSPHQTVKLVPPRLDVVNPIGAGDCLAAGTALGIVQGKEVPDALALGVAAAAENVGQLLPARLSSESVRRRAATIRRQDV